MKNKLYVKSHPKWKETPFAHIDSNITSVEKNLEMIGMLKNYYNVNPFPRHVSGYFNHCVKSVLIRSYFGLYSPVFSPNTGKYGPEKTPYLDTFNTLSAKFIK